MKNTQKHTQGPWTIENCTNEDGSKFLSINGQGPWGSWLADIQAGNINGKPADIGPLHLANAQLIAAAPDLLTQLQSIRVELEAQALGYTAIEIWPHVRAEMIRRILLTIAKAEGVK